MKTSLYTTRLIIDGIEITVEYKFVKQISIRISRFDRQVKMSVPPTIAHDKIIEIIEHKKDWIKNKIAHLESIQLSNANLMPNQNECDEFAALFLPLLKKWEQRMQIEASKVSLKFMTSRWGSCQPQTRNLSFSYMLAKKPIECIEYVIIHELAHIVHANHSTLFWALVSQYCPDYKNCRSKLRQQNV